MSYGNRNYRQTGIFSVMRFSGLPMLCQWENVKCGVSCQYVN